jgi:putative ABC transport system ATP-binding protein
MIELKNISKIYKKDKIEIVAVDDVSVKVEKGEFLAIMGISGSGKSTLMNIIGCLDKHTKGDYLLDGKNIMEYSNKELAKIRNDKIGFVFQTFNLLPRMNCIMNVELPLFYAGWKRNKRREKAITVLQEVGLVHRLTHKPIELSGGEMQRVAIARALINNPKILCADEPTGNLDSKNSEEIMQIFKELNEKKKVTIILVTHEQYIASFAQRIIRLKDGKIVGG